ncbi:MAG TPA: branched-chain amino acid transaminase [Candidatus Nanoarchaeia archaeon]|nr:branched-chain amino acid transaminase [Candidatus Nanoarchaeia archaeon]
MEKTDFIWLNGKLVKWEDAKVHVLIHALHYGSAVFEGIRFYKTDKGPAVFRLKEHMARLLKSAKVFNMKIPFTQEQLEEATLETIRKNKIDAGYIRPIAFFGYGKMGLNPEGAPVDVAIAVWPWGSYLGEEAVKVKISKYMRIHPKSLISDAKVSGHYVNSILASLEAKEAGYQECLLLDYTGNIAEGPGENFFLIKKGKLYTPQLGNILPGITRDSIMKIAKDLGYDSEEKVISVKDAKSADECFYTGTAAEVTGIRQIDDVQIGDDNYPITKKLKTAFLDVVHGRNKKYESWLSYAK